MGPTTVRGSGSDWISVRVRVERPGWQSCDRQCLIRRLWWPLATVEVSDRASKTRQGLRLWYFTSTTTRRCWFSLDSGERDGGGGSWRRRSLGMEWSYGWGALNLLKLPVMVILLEFDQENGISRSKIEYPQNPRFFISKCLSDYECVLIVFDPGLETRDSYLYYFHSDQRLGSH